LVAGWGIVDWGGSRCLRAVAVVARVCQFRDGDWEVGESRTTVKETEGGNENTGLMQSRPTAETRKAMEVWAFSLCCCVDAIKFQWDIFSFWVGLVQLVSASSPSHQVLGSKLSLCRISAG
jgi:hypothetical protein